MRATGLRGWMQRHPRAVDVLVAVLVLGLSLRALPPTGDPVGGDPPELTVLETGLLLVACAALLLRRTHPVLAWAVALAAMLFPLPADSVGRGLPATIAALYAVAAYGGRRAAVLTAAATMLAALVVVARAGLLDSQDPVGYAVVAWCALAAALGDAVRSDRAVLAAALDRAQRAEQTREEEAQRRVTEERLRISRDLHDVVAHHIAVVNVQAGAAEHLASTDPSAAAEALQRVRAASSAALQEMGDLVALLRAEDGGAGGDQPGAALEPAPGVADLPRLVDALRAGGEEVRWRHSGPRLRVPPSADVHVYRIVQEGLTNAARHGRGPIELDTRQSDEELVLEVRNGIRPAAEAQAGDASRAAPAAGGHGLTGMRERAALVGGRLEAGPAGDGSFRVRVAVPAGGGS